MAELNHSAKAREDWRRVNAHIHQEEQKLKELQLDHSEKVAVVEALKAELRQTRHETQECEQKELKLVQAVMSGYKKRQELEQQWKAMEMDRALLMQQLAAAQDGLKADTSKIEQAKADFEKELMEQQAYIHKLQQLVASQQHQQDDDGTLPVDDAVPDGSAVDDSLPLDAVAEPLAVTDA